MKNHIFYPIIFFLIFGFFTTLFGNSNIKNNENLKGISLCNEIYSILNKNKFNPSVQDLLLNGKNSFPYNIIVTLENNTKKDKYFIFTFYQEDFLQHKDLIINLISEIKQKNYDFNTIFLFSYGERQSIEKYNMIFGINTFLNAINTTDDYSNIIIDLSSDKNSINTSSKGITAPSWLIQNEYNAYIKNNIDENIPYFYLSQLYTYDFFYDRMLSSFFDYDIPSVKLNFLKDGVDEDIIASVLLESIDSYNLDSERNWDQHFFMAKLGNHFKKLTEEKTIQIIIMIIFVWLLFILLLIFINKRMKKQAWGTIKHIWYIMPVTILLTSIGFIIGKKISLRFFQTDSVIYNAFILIESQTIFAFVLVSIFYAVTLSYNYWFYEKSIDYLIVIACFINQSFFILIDISLFPIFMVICFLSILALYIKSNGLHIAIFFLMLLPFIPYILAMIDYADFYTLYNFLITNNSILFFVPCIIYPSFIIYFRVLTSIRRKSKINIPILMNLILIAMSLLIVMTGTLKGVSLKNKEEQKVKISAIETIPTTEELIKLDYYDTMVFDDLVRTIKITFKEQPEQCSIYVESESSAPILYTENAYEYITPNKYMFYTPSVPPKNLNFSYGTTSNPSVITVSATFSTDNKQIYKKTQKVVTIGK